jgi:hypothetical protein
MKLISVLRVSQFSPENGKTLPFSSAELMLSQEKSEISQCQTALLPIVCDETDLEVTFHAHGDSAKLHWVPCDSAFWDTQYGKRVAALLKDVAWFEGQNCALSVAILPVDVLPSACSFRFFTKGKVSFLSFTKGSEGVLANYGWLTPLDSNRFSSPALTWGLTDSFISLLVSRKAQA